MSNQRLLIITSSPLCRNPRVLKEASTLGQAGYDVTVLTIAGRECDEVTDRTLLKAAPFRKLALPYFGFHGTLGLGAHTGRTFTSIARKLVPWGIERRSALGAFHRLLAVARRTPSDLAIVHTELGLAIGHELMGRGRAVAADFEDWHSEDLLPEARRLRPVSLLRKIEIQLLNKARYVTVPSRSMAEALGRIPGARKPTVIYNSFPLQAAPARQAVRHIPSLYWFSQTIGPGRGLEPFLAAWLRTASNSTLCLQGEVSESYKKSLLALVGDSNKPPIIFLSPCPPDELPRQIALHDVGLALENQTPPSRDLTITNKLLQYLNAGLAIIASPTTGHREVLGHTPGAGLFINPGNPEQTAARIDRLCHDQALLVSMQQAARGLAANIWHWEKEAPTLLGLVKHALEKPAS